MYALFLLAYSALPVKSISRYLVGFQIIYFSIFLQYKVLRISHFIFIVFHSFVMMIAAGFFIPVFYLFLLLNYVSRFDNVLKRVFICSLNICFVEGLFMFMLCLSLISFSFVALIN